MNSTFQLVVYVCFKTYMYILCSNFNIFCDNILQNVKIYFIIILGIVKFSFWSMTAENPMAAYACVNLGE